MLTIGSARCAPALCTHATSKQISDVATTVTGDDIVPHMLRRITAGLALLLASASGDAADAHAQDSARADVSRWIFAGSEAENYLRYLQTLGMVREYPWSVRAFSSSELRRLRPASTDHPWANAPTLRARPIQFGGATIQVAPAEISTWYNTTFPYGMNDGPVWVGRGLTGQASGGVSARWGPLELTLAPTAFWTENRGFPLFPTGAGVSPFADGVIPGGVDRPQRFGPRGYGAIDPGQSTLRLDLLGIAVGVSSANQWWGPMSDFPFILGNNAAGFPHVFVGTSRAQNIFIGHVHTKVIYGRLEQTAFSVVPPDSASRFGAGMVVTFAPRGFPGLEVGGARFFHVPWPKDGLERDYFMHLFETFLKRRIEKDFLLHGPTGSSIDNQLASAFARWSLGKSGFEVYGEYGREDHSRDAYDLLMQPDHSAIYGFGMRKAWRSSSSITAVRGEIMNFQTNTLLRHRLEGGVYSHTYTRQGHTHRGQLLASAITAGGGAGATIVVERFDDSGSVHGRLSRLVVGDPDITTRIDVQYVLRIENRRHRQQSALETRYALDAIYDFNRRFGADVGNLRLSAAAVWHH
jgi:hypothetical protein